MKITDLFIRRPVLAAGGQPGHHHRRAAGDPDPQRPPVPAQRERDGHRHHRLRRRQRRTWCAASSPRRWSAPSPPPTASSTWNRKSTLGLSTINVRLKLNYDSTKALAEISSKVDQVRRDLPPEAEVPVINIESADSRFASAYLSFSSDILQAERDHRLPGARRPAAPFRHPGGAAGRHPRRPHLRHAHLAQARPDGGPRHQPGPGAPGPGRQQLPVGARPEQGGVTSRST